MGADQDGDGLISDKEMQQLFARTFAIDVCLSFIDPVYDSKMRFSHRYYLRDVVTHAQWVDMLRKDVLSVRADGSAERVRIVFDHGLMDSYTEASPPQRAPPPPTQSSVIRRLLSPLL